MKILAIDTTHGESSLALWADSILVQTITDKEENKQAEHLVPLIEDILKQAGFSYKDLSAVAVNIGPGSFTGVRIGMAAANGIKLACNVPLIAVTSFESVAHLITTKKDILVVLDAHRGQVYCQRFDSDKAPVTEPALVTYDEIYNHALKSDFILIGDGAELVKGVLTSRGLNFILENPLAVSESASIAKIAAEKFKKHEYSYGIQPLYIRLPDAKTSVKKEK
ncbi:MAG: tsaB [Rickettsiaceae bacterium]|nr:tsaB [Rickettsiaceae bacterium]